MYPWKRKNSQHHLDEKNHNGVTWLSFPALEESGMVSHAFSTRMGGVSTGHFSSLNLGRQKYDDPENVRKNHDILGSAVGYAKEQTVFPRQEHTDIIRSPEAFCKNLNCQSFSNSP